MKKYNIINWDKLHVLVDQFLTDAMSGVDLKDESARLVLVGILPYLVIRHQEKGYKNQDEMAQAISTLTNLEMPQAQAVAQTYMNFVAWGDKLTDTKSA